MNDTQPKYKTHEDYVSEVLSRYSVQDLVEQTDADLYIGDERFYKAANTINVIAQGEESFIKWWKVQSGENVYEVRRFKNFVFCSCKDFFFRKKVCKHVSITARVYCMNCFQLSATVGKYCFDCDQKINHFLRPSHSASAAINTTNL
jgi:hypothetical protein